MREVESLTRRRLARDGGGGGTVEGHDVGLGQALTVDAVERSAREPDEVAAGVHGEGDGLGRVGVEGEVEGVVEGEAEGAVVREQREGDLAAAEAVVEEAGGGAGGGGLEEVAGGVESGGGEGVGEGEEDGGGKRGGEVVGDEEEENEGTERGRHSREEKQSPLFLSVLERERNGGEGEGFERVLNRGGRLGLTTRWMKLCARSCGWFNRFR